MSTKTLRYIYDQVGSDFFIGMYGEKEDIENAYNMAYNFEVTNGELHWLHDKFAYYGTDRGRAQSQFPVIFTEEMRQDVGVLEATPGMVKEGKKMTKDFLANLPHERFVESLRDKLF